MRESKQKSDGGGCLVALKHKWLESQQQQQKSNLLNATSESESVVESS